MLHVADSCSILGVSFEHVFKDVHALSVLLGSSWYICFMAASAVMSNFVAGPSWLAL